MRSDAWAGASSSCNIQVWFSYSSGLFLRIESLKSAKNSWYCTTVCLPSDHVVKIHDGQWLSKQKTQPTSLWSLTDSSVLFFWSRRPFLNPLRRLHLGFNIILIHPRLISCYGVLKKVFIIICINKQFLTVGSFSDRQSTNAARILHWRDASEFFQ